MRGKPTRKTHHARPRTIRQRSTDGQQQPDGSVVQVSPTKRKCVLVVEDNATIGGLLVALLREEGYRALRAWDGREAIKMSPTASRKPRRIALPYPCRVSSTSRALVLATSSEVPAAALLLTTITSSATPVATISSML